MRRDNNAFETASGASGDLSYWDPNTWRTSLAPADTVPLSGWKHLAWRNDSVEDTMELFVDGVLTSTGTAVAAPSGFVRVGSQFGGVENFAGPVDDLQLYDRPLSDAAILALLDPPDFDFRNLSIGRAEDGTSATITFSSQVGKIYSAFFSADLEAGAWLEINANIDSAGEVTNFTDTEFSPIFPDGGFYQIRENPPLP